jgi:hypothetical protein
MRKLHLRAGLTTAGALGLATLLVTVGTAVITAPPASADPTFPSSLVGVGSDTIQDLFNAFSGAEPVNIAGQAATFYTPLHSSDATGDVTVTSYDAVDPKTGAAGCLSPSAKLGGSELDRPNGSGAGMNALSAANDGSAFAPTSNCGETGSSTGDATGAFDFSRSSSGPNATKFPGSQLTFIPFARDGVSYIFYSPAQADKGLGDVGAMTSTQLQALYGTGNNVTSGKITLSDGHTVFACMMQPGSGTGKFFDQAMGNDGTGTTSDNSAIASGCGDTLEENGGNTFVTNSFIAGLSATQDAIMPFSIGSWVAQNNQAAQDRSATARADGANIGTIDALGAPYTSNGATPPILTSSPTFFASTTYGRDLYVVVPTSKLGVGNAALKSLFASISGSTPSICAAAAQATVVKFGFISALAAGQTCGMTTLTQGFTQ